MSLAPACNTFAKHLHHIKRSLDQDLKYKSTTTNVKRKGPSSWQARKPSAPGEPCKGGAILTQAPFPGTNGSKKRQNETILQYFIFLSSVASKYNASDAPHLHVWYLHETHLQIWHLRESSQLFSSSSLKAEGSFGGPPWNWTPCGDHARWSRGMRWKMRFCKCNYDNYQIISNSTVSLSSWWNLLRNHYNAKCNLHLLLPNVPREPSRKRPKPSAEPKVSLGGNFVDLSAYFPGRTHALILHRGPVHSLQPPRFS